MFSKIGADFYTEMRILKFLSERKKTWKIDIFKKKKKLVARLTLTFGGFNLISNSGPLPVAWGFEGSVQYLS